MTTAYDISMYGHLFEYILLCQQNAFTNSLVECSIPINLPFNQVILVTCTNCSFSTDLSTFWNIHLHMESPVTAIGHCHQVFKGKDVSSSVICNVNILWYTVANLFRRYYVGSHLSYIHGIRSLSFCGRKNAVEQLLGSTNLNTWMSKFF